MRSIIFSLLLLAACDPGVQQSICGDGALQPNEECDDGNTTTGDGCSAQCNTELCGDSIVNNGESCDDGNTNNTDFCRNTCVLPACGDGIIDSFGINPELCDDGNTASGDGCSAACQIEQTCGNGVVEGTEGCDDGNNINDDNCRNNCVLPACGDGIVDSFGFVPESCDDGNQIDGDGCSASCLREPFAGNCDAPFPGSIPEQFQHNIASNLTILAGAPNHQIRDIVVNPGEAGTMLARFTYGIIDKDLADEHVEVWIQTCPGWESLGVFTTDADGFIQIPIDGSLPKGDYSMKAVVLGDSTIADGFLAVWPTNTQVVVSDIDGTLTTSDFELITDLFLSSDAEMFTDANTMINTWSGKEYRLVFLTGRPQLVNRYSRNWLHDHGFPRGVLKLTDSNTEVIPTDSGVQQFKADFLNDIKTRVGAQLLRAYGNATTDIGAYEAVGIPKTETFIIGTHAGEQNTQPITTYTEHLPSLVAIPNATQP